MEIKIIFENNNFVVIDKPAGIVVHPGAGEISYTLVDWLKEKYPKTKDYSWPEKERAGIVHRLDKDTSGLMILAKNPETLNNLQEQIRQHRVNKKYQALVLGQMEKKEGEIETLIGRDPHHRRQQVARSIFFDFSPGQKREAKTKYTAIKEYLFKDNVLSLIEASLETGRTHQIRVQFKSIGHPLIGDQTYNTKLSRQISKALGLKRQFLHAYYLQLEDPKTNQSIELKSLLPKDLATILENL